MELIQQCYHDLCWGALVLLGLGLLAVMVYIIAILAYLLEEDYLVDVAIVYVVLSFIAVMLLCRIYINLYQYKRQDEREDESHDR